MQEKISKQVFIVPFNDIPDEVINTNPELSAFQKSGINGKIDGYRERFRDYWNNNVAACDISVLAINAHANQNLIYLYKDRHGFEREKFSELGFIFPKINYAVFLGCNVGDTSYDNFADTFANPPENHQEGKDKWIESTVEV